MDEVVNTYEPTPLQLAEHELAEARQALLWTEHGADDAAALDRYVVALEKRNALRLTDEVPS